MFVNNERKKMKDKKILKSLTKHKKIKIKIVIVITLKRIKSIKLSREEKKLKTLIKE